MSHRASLGTISERNANVRANSRASLGPSRVSTGQNQKPFYTTDNTVENANTATFELNVAKPSRLSIAGIAPGRTSVGVSRRSSLGNPLPIQARKSSVNARGSSLAMSRADDPRNINDKDFMKNSIPVLINYLVQHSFDHSISPKILTRPAVKDFNNIVLFLFKQFDPNFACAGKFEDEVIGMFKQLKYPYQISKTNLVAAGSPTAWPALLASIMWLIELLAYDEKACIGQPNPDNEFDDPNGMKSFFAFLSRAYTCFLGGDDETHDMLKEQFIESYESVNLMISDQIHKNLESNKQLERSIREFEGKTERLKDIRQLKKDCDEDLLKFQNLIEALVQKNQYHENAISKYTHEEKDLNVQVKQLLSDNDALKIRIANQELSQEEVRRMTEKRDKTDEAHQLEAVKKDALNKKVWELETILRDKVQELDESARRYNSTAEDLKLVPHTARNARGKHLEIEIDTRAKKKSMVIKTDIRSSVISVLQQLKQELSDSSIGYREELVTLQDAVDDVDIKITANQEELTTTEARAKRADEMYRREKETFDAAQVAHEREMDEIDGRLMKLKDTSIEDMRIAAATRRSTEIQAARDARASAHKRMKRELMEAIMEAVTQCAAHREFAQQKLSETKGMMKTRLENFLLSSGMKSKETSVQNAKAAIEYDQIYLEEDEGEFNPQDSSFTYDAPPSMGGMSPINGIGRQKIVEVTNDCDSSTMSMVPGLASVNLTLLAKEQSIRSRLTRASNIKSVDAVANLNAIHFDNHNMSICSSTL